MSPSVTDEPPAVTRGMWRSSKARLLSSTSVPVVCQSQGGAAGPSAACADDGRTAGVGRARIIFVCLSRATAQTTSLFLFFFDRRHHPRLSSTFTLPAPTFRHEARHLCSVRPGRGRRRPGKRGGFGGGKGGGRDAISGKRPWGAVFLSHTPPRHPPTPTVRGDTVRQWR